MGGKLGMSGALAFALLTVLPAMAQTQAPAPGKPAIVADASVILQTDGDTEVSGLTVNPRVLFMSPAGEPFRGGSDMTASMKQWFDQADANHNGALSPVEFLADHMRFYRLVDERSDGVVDAFDVARYERDIAPEISGVDAQGRRLKIGARGPASKPVPRIKFGKPPPDREGAARYSALAEIEPLRNADRDFDYKITVVEWAAAATRRFAALDANHDGKIEFKELELPPEPWAYGERNAFNECFNCEYAPLYQWPY